MQVRVITLSGKVPLQISKVFPETEPFAAIDTRSIDIQVMLRNGIITQGGAETLEHGRKCHHELSGKGGVGLHQRNRGPARCFSWRTRGAPFGHPTAFPVVPDLRLVEYSFIAVFRQYLHIFISDPCPGPRAAIYQVSV